MPSRTRMKIYVEDEYGGVLVPFNVKLTGRMLTFEVTRDTQHKGEETAQNILSAIMEMLASAHVSFTTDATDSMPPHRLSISVRPR